MPHSQKYFVLRLRLLIVLLLCFLHLRYTCQGQWLGHRAIDYRDLDLMKIKMLGIESRYRSLSSVENEQIGRRLYRDKEYSEAIKAFSAVRTKSSSKNNTEIGQRQSHYAMKHLSRPSIVGLVRLRSFKIMLLHWKTPSA